MTESFRIAIAGLGTVGVGVVKLIQENSAIIERRLGRKVEIVAVSSRDSSKDRGVDLSAYEWVCDARTLAQRNDIDAVVEMIGGSEGIALDLCREALSSGIHVITANKAMLAHHGEALAKLADAHGCCLMYEASVAGAIPIVKSLREGFAGNRVSSVYGILNGTSNYILTEMRETGRSFDEVLPEAQEKGYAELDPAFDVDGVDAAHKICILSALAFGAFPDFNSVSVRGIRDVTIEDIHFAAELGYKVKLLAIARQNEAGVVNMVEPCLVPENSPIGAVEGVFNAVCVEADYLDSALEVGRGAGEKPTASSVVSDIIDLARDIYLPVFGAPFAALRHADIVSQGSVASRFYLRLHVVDRPGVLAEITSIMRDHYISLEAVLQRGRDPENPVTIVMTCHAVEQEKISLAMKEIEALEIVLDKPALYRIEDF